MGLCLLASLSLHAASTKRTVRIESVPTAAAVTVNGATVGRTPHTLKDFRFVDDPPLQVTVSAADHEPRAYTVTRLQAREYSKDAKEEMVLRCELPLLRKAVPVALSAGAGAQYYVDNAMVDAQTQFLFSRDSSQAEFNRVAVRAEKEGHTPAQTFLSMTEAEALPLVGGRRLVQLLPVEVQRAGVLKVETNERDAQVLLNGVLVGVAGPGVPAEVQLTFRRADAGAPWSTNEIAVAKEGFEYLPPLPAEARTNFTTLITWNKLEELQGRLAVTNLQALRFLPVPWRRVVVDRGQVRLEVTDVNSAISATAAVSPFSPFLEPDELFIADRFGVVSSPIEKGKPTAVVVAVAKRAMRGDAPAEIIGSEIVMVQPPPARVVRRLTTIGDKHDTFDLQPCITTDGEWVFFASNRERGEYRIFRKPTKAGLVLAEVSPPQPGIDLEPAVFTPSDGGHPRLAFTRYPSNAAVRGEPKIMVQGADGTFSRLGEGGHSPAWSYNGAKIAYVSTSGRICLMDAQTGVSEGALATGAAPAWLPGDKQIIYAEPANKSFGLRLINADGSGSPTRVVQDSSFYSFPMVSWDNQKTFIYFISNREAQRRGEESWALYFVEWRPEGRL
ncbi:MAG: PEGA domain-containing protein [Verrucomicrobia bacterium]|nr:PEGA domain-containing protein [Verrucomicrobiota bacterium]